MVSGPETNPHWVGRSVAHSAAGLPTWPSWPYTAAPMTNKIMLDNHPSPAAWRLVLLAGSLSMLWGCGQKGPLYLSDPQPRSPELIVPTEGPPPQGVELEPLESDESELNY